MAVYTPHTNEDIKAMKRAVGKLAADLYSDIPESVRIKSLELPKGISEEETQETLTALSQKNRAYLKIMRGAGAYDHYIPPVVTALASRSEFVTAYTPYQAEMSQGILQAIFEYQTMITELTGMDVSNASVYDGATAAAEALIMCRERDKNEVIISAAVRPDTAAVIKTYLAPLNVKLIIAPIADGATDTIALSTLLNSKTAGVYIEYPNYFGIIEDAAAIGEKIHAAGARFVMGCNPISLGLLKSPREMGADIAVGEGQPLGIPLAFGGPYLGFMTAKAELVRRLPGRIVGETTDKEGRRAYVLTLQAREQHIRRENASSSICSNEAHCALTAAIYLAAMGPEGLKEVAENCTALAHFAADKFTKTGKLKLKYKGEFFHEFVTVSDISSEKILAALDKKGVLGGLPLSDSEILWCATEKLSAKDITAAARIIERLV